MNPFSLWNPNLHINFPSSIFFGGWKQTFNQPSKEPTTTFFLLFVRIVFSVQKRTYIFMVLKIRQYKDAISEITDFFFFFFLWIFWFCHVPESLLTKCWKYYNYNFWSYIFSLFETWKLEILRCSLFQREYVCHHILLSSNLYDVYGALIMIWRNICLHAAASWNFPWECCEACECAHQSCRHVALSSFWLCGAWPLCEYWFIFLVLSVGFLFI